MRKVILFMHVSLDGYVCGTHGEMDWVTINDWELDKYMGSDLLKTTDTMLLGRELYRGFEQAWPPMATNQDSPKDLVEFANWIIDSPKIVFSKTEQALPWKSSKQILVRSNDDIVNAVIKLKQEQGGDMVLFGGAGMAQSFVQLNLIDEFRIKLEPTILGNGKPLFQNILQKRKLKLTQSKAFDSGVIAIYYEKVEN